MLVRDGGKWCKAACLLLGRSCSWHQSVSHSPSLASFPKISDFSGRIGEFWDICVRNSYYLPLYLLHQILPMHTHT